MACIHRPGWNVLHFFSRLCRICRTGSIINTEYGGIRQDSPAIRRRHDGVSTFPVHSRIRLVSLRFLLVVRAAEYVPTDAPGNQAVLRTHENDEIETIEPREGTGVPAPIDVQSSSWLFKLIICMDMLLSQHTTNQNPQTVLEDGNRVRQEARNRRSTACINA